MTTNSFLFGSQSNKKDNQKQMDKLYDHINKYLRVQKKYPGRKYLTSYLGVSEKEIVAMLDLLVTQNKLAKKNDSYYIPGLETYEALQKEVKAGPVVVIDNKIREEIINHPELLDNNIPELRDRKSVV